MNIKQILQQHNDEWDTFVLSSNNGTIFHQLKFLSYHHPEKFQFHHLAFYKDNTLVAVLPGALENGIFSSPMGASYGSFVTADSDFSDYEELIDSLLTYAQENAIKEIRLTPPPLIYMNRQNEIERFLLSYKGFEVEKHLITNVVNLESATVETLMDNLTSMARRNVKKADELGVTVRFSDDFDSFYPMLVENKQKFDVKPAHTLEELKKLKELFPDKIRLLAAYSADNTLIGGIVLFVTNTKTLLAFYICHYFEYQEQRAVNKLLFEVLRFALENNYQYVDLGVSMNTAVSNPMEPSRSLIFFKEGIQSRGFLRTTYKKTL